MGEPFTDVPQVPQPPVFEVMLDLSTQDAPHRIENVAEVGAVGKFLIVRYADGVTTMIPERDVEGVTIIPVELLEDSGEGEDNQGS